MTESEAIKELQDNIDLPFGVTVSDEASRMSINALEKQIPKRHKERDCIGYNILVCPVCKEVLYLYEPYCDNCGQAIDWSESE